MKAVTILRQGKALTRRTGAARLFSTTTRMAQEVVRRQNSMRASYYRGGSSRAIMVQREDLPASRDEWGPIFLASIGSPDPHARQLDGMGGGISSLSKVCVIGQPTHPDADIDYTFISLGIKDTSVDYSSNCGNMLAAVGPYAIDVGAVSASAVGAQTSKGVENVTVRIHNTNTKKIIHSTFPVIDGAEAAASGSLAIDGVSGTASAIELQFMKPAGSRTGKLLPTDSATDVVDGIKVTCLDAGNPCVFVPASSLGVAGNLTPQEIDDHPTLKARLESIRRQAAVCMGLATSEDKTPGSVPKIAIVAPPTDPSLANIEVRAMSVGQPHKAIPVTVALAVAAAAKLPGSVVFDSVQNSADDSTSPIVIHHASGTLGVDSKYSGEGELESATVLRTARRLMEGKVFWK
ncbi:DUF453 domain protein [Xylariaceae sp. FL1019]|nr:DUF453 domain protein [Xylariaceae sp. FL1019]